MMKKESEISKNFTKNLSLMKDPIYLSPTRVLTGAKSGSQCSKFSEAEPGTVWNRIFKKHMMENESCIGKEKASKQMQETNELLTMFYYSYGKEHCNVKEKSSIQSYVCGFIQGYICIAGLLLYIEISLFFQEKLYLNNQISGHPLVFFG